MSLSNSVENKLLDHLFGGTQFTVTSPTTLALVKVAVTDSDTASTITKCDYGAYADLSLASSSMGAASGGSKANSTLLAFPQATSGSNSAVGFAVIQGTDVIFYGTVPTTTISTGITPEFAVGSLVATAD